MKSSKKIIICLLLLFVVYNNGLSFYESGGHLNSSSRSGNRTKYNLEELAQMDSIPVNDVQGLYIDHYSMEENWIDIIGTLIYLEHIDIAYYETERSSSLYCEELRAEFGKLEKLKGIGIVFDTLYTIPDIFSKCKQLKGILISGYQLNNVPQSILKLKYLEHLNITVDNLEMIPENIGKLKSLTSIWINCDSLASLPKSIGKLTNLEMLIISSRKLKVIPDIWSNLNHLKEIRIYSQSLERIEGTMVGLDSLERLRLHKILNLRALPDSIGSLPYLNSLQIESGWALESLGNLKSSISLKHLKIDGRKLEVWVDDIGQIKNLESLEIGVLEMLRLTDEQLMKLINIPSIELNTQYQVEDGINNSTYQYFRRTATKEQLEQLEHLYEVLPQIIRINL